MRMGKVPDFDKCERDGSLSERRPADVEAAKNGELHYFLVDAFDIVPKPLVIESRCAVPEKRGGRITARLLADRDLRAVYCLRVTQASQCAHGLGYGGLCVAVSARICWQDVVKSTV